MRLLWVKLRELRIDGKAISQGKAAKLIGASSSLMNRWLHGNQKPGLAYVFAIEREFGIAPELWSQAPTERIRLRLTKAA